MQRRTAIVCFGLSAVLLVCFCTPAPKFTHSNTDRATPFAQSGEKSMPKEHALPNAKDAAVLIEDPADSEQLSLGPAQNSNSVATTSSFYQEGTAVYYGLKFHGRKTASGERYDINKFTAAHRTLPFGSMVRVTNLGNDKTVVVRINDRGLYGSNHIIDLSLVAAKAIGLGKQGCVRVKLELEK